MIHSAVVHVRVIHLVYLSVNLYVLRRGQRASSAVLRECIKGRCNESLFVAVYLLKTRREKYIVIIIEERG